MANNPSFSFYVNDFEGGTRHMTDAELGCYLRVLIAQFNRKGVLPNDEKFLRRFTTSFDESWPIVKEKFHEVGGGLIQNKRLEIERVKKEKFLQNQAENGKKGGRPKKPTAKPENNPKETQPFDLLKPDQKPLGNGNGNSKEELYSEGGTEEGLIFDGEKEILGNQKEFERICMVTYSSADQGKKVLRNYHLWLQEKDKYPVKRKTVYAGLEKWLNNDKNFSKNGRDSATAIGKTFEPD